MMALEHRCLDFYYSDPENAYVECAKIPAYVEAVSGGIDRLDVRYFLSNVTEQEERLKSFMNDPVIKGKINIGSASPLVYGPENRDVYMALKMDGLNSYVDLYTEILEMQTQYPILIYTGGWDILDGPTGQEAWIHEMEWSGLTMFRHDPRKLYYYPSDDDGSMRVGGYYKQYANFHFLVIHAAGHLVPSTQMAASRRMFKDMITEQKLQCHGADDCLVTEKSCNSMINCSEHGQCHEGRCICDKGFYGEDCATQVEAIGGCSFNLGPYEWKHFMLKENLEFLVEVHSDWSIEAFQRVENIPNHKHNSVY